jgi:hypothetical protein
MCIQRSFVARMVAKNRSALDSELQDLIERQTRFLWVGMYPLSSLEGMNLHADSIA